MKLPNNLGLKAYVILFSIVAMGSFLSLTQTEGSTYVYYNTLLRFNSAALIWYVLAILDAILGCLTALPLTLRAFSKPPIWTRLFQIFFILRILTIFLGHNYEWVVLRSAFIGTPIVGWLTLAVWCGFTFPSFKEHFIYAFQSKK
jgi:Na+/melibiose symporter-like transporter